MPPMPAPPAAAAAAASAAGSGLSATMDSVVRTQAAMEAAFSRAVLVTLVGSTMPERIKSSRKVGYGYNAYTATYCDMIP